MKRIPMETKKMVWGGALIVAAACIGLAALGCGRQQERAASSAGETIVPAIAETTPAAAVETPPALPEREGIVDARSGEEGTLPPDVAATVTQPIGAPGTIVEITAQGSSDVASVVLTDGLGKSYPFVYDSTATVWRINYRVPITATDRVGLSVTATNDSGQRKRVWVFVRTREMEEGEGC